MKDEIDEGMIGRLTGFALFAALLAIPEILPARIIHDTLVKTYQSQSAQQKDYFNITNKELQDELKKLTDSGKKVNGWSVSNFVNAVSRTLYAESRNQDSNARRAILTSMLNRCKDENKEELISVISEYKAFSCWNGIKDRKTYFTDGGFVFKAPTTLFDKNGKLIKAENDKWEDSKTMVVQVVLGKFTKSSELNANQNSYYAPANMPVDPKTKQHVKPSWEKNLQNKVTIGGQIFGYLKDQDPKYHGERSVTDKKNSKTIARNTSKASKIKNIVTKTTKNIKKSIYHTIKSGDTLFKLAKNNGTTVEKIAKLNNMKTTDILKIGKTIRIT